jgi:hypothetical protein
VKLLSTTGRAWFVAMVADLITRPPPVAGPASRRRKRPDHARRQFTLAPAGKPIIPGKVS